MNAPVKNALVTLVIHMGLLSVLMYALDLNIYAVVWANTFFSFMMCILNGRAIRRHLKYRQEIMRTFVVPGISALIMGGAVYGVYELLMVTLGINAVATIVSIAVGVCVYGVVLLLLRGLRENELKRFPMGDFIVRVAKKMKLM